MFRAFSLPSSGAQLLQWQPLVLPSYRGDSRAVFVIGPVITVITHHDCHYDTNVKPEAATAVIELLMMGGKTPETMLSCKQTSG
jgi:(2Fe-2S) ferredoxin